MPLILPNLDDVTWSQLGEDARSQIPGYTSAWTNYNASDPGITLVELFAYFMEQLLYRVNRIGDRQTIEYLRLLNGPQWKRSKSLDEEKSLAVLQRQTLRRAVTASDFETLTLAWNEQAKPLEHEGLARVKCIVERNLDDPEPATRATSAPGHVSLVVVLKRNATPSMAFLVTVKHALDSARLLTTRVHVVPARFITVGVRFTLVLRSDAQTEQVRSDPRSGLDEFSDPLERLQHDALTRLEKFLDPLHGGTDGKGWPFGRSIYVSELYRLLSNVPGVDYVSRSKDPATGHELDELTAGKNNERRLKRNSLGELESMDLNPDELVALWISPDDLTLEVR
jgi:hypothetical protein